MLLWVGLGNPEPGMARQRHNIGFMALDVIANRHGFGPWRPRFKGLVAEGRVGGQKILALKPMTYMNASASRCSRRFPSSRSRPTTSASFTMN